MTITRITPELLARCTSPLDGLTPRAACKLVRDFGPVAAWWLHPAVLDQAANRQTGYRCLTDRPELPISLGSCWVLFVLKGVFPLLRPAVLLPLRWQRNGSHRGLPPALQLLAEKVVDQFRVSNHGADCDWRLELSWPAVDLQFLEADQVSVESGWASLFGGLLLASQGRLPSPDVWITAAWHPDHGLDRVDSLRAKLELAVAWQARTMFVPAVNGDADYFDLDSVQNGKLTVKRLERNPKPSTPQVALSKYLAQLGQPPNKEEPFELRCVHYANIEKKPANDYYWSDLFDEVVDRCRANLLKQHPDCKPTHVVSIVATNPSNTALLPAVLRATHCLLFYDQSAEFEQSSEKSSHSDILRIANDVKRKLKGKPYDAKCSLNSLFLGNRCNELRQVHDALKSFSVGIAPQRLIFDLTPGFKSLTLALRDVAPVGSWFAYCRHHQQAHDNRIRPGSENFECWQADNSNPPF